MSDFKELLNRFAAAVEANDGAGLTALFSPDGTYVDYFFGPFSGRDAIVGMLQHFHDDAHHYKWSFMDPVSDGHVGYARYLFSYVSKMADSAGRAVVFDGMSCFKLKDGKIAHYSEVFDRGTALAQLDFAPERLKKALGKFATKQNARVDVAPHVERVKALGARVA